MISFTDLNGYRVTLVFEPKQVEIEPRHVLVLVRHNGKWLLTRHKDRGIEFPGGKAEGLETLEEAATREVLEETGIQIKDVLKIGAYVVHSDPPFGKAIFLAKHAGEVEFMPLETEGAIWMTDDEIDQCSSLSFYMLDDGMAAIRRRVRQLETEWND